ncbi:KEOPS complex subunit Pcc1 [Desulfurococcus mucosus]|uniref:Uncharacterized protein n=1 Tax=Desulfurococcus mucosus (strain ATCC 35584 / DSM 2162 / JCM 9187 / O7/1) TaxID=765177 RepID=E8R7E0_DESM0|nr:KEOPS complex subunit Pcc1 [Desulfurococcus mucosus]ADV65605.1 hypothetical protein Desmu_1311 [Desulfurococcus mucosus DSM 2162]
MEAGDAAAPVASALKPDLEDMPEGCRGGAVLNGSVLVLRLSCRDAGSLKALNNSSINMLLMLLDVVEVLKG